MGHSKKLCIQCTYEIVCYPKGCAAPGNVQGQCNAQGLLSKLEEAPPQRKIDVTSKSPVGDISVVTLIRTDTTLDHSQKAGKVCSRQIATVAHCRSAVHSCVSTAPHRTTPNYITPHRTTPNYITPHNITPHHARPHSIHHTTPCHTALMLAAARELTAS